MWPTSVYVDISKIRNIEMDRFLRIADRSNFDCSASGRTRIQFSFEVHEKAFDPRITMFESIFYKRRYDSKNTIRII